jgi:hypothetical protein
VIVGIVLTCVLSVVVRIVGIVLACVLSGCHGDCRFVLYLLVFCRIVAVIFGIVLVFVVIVGMYYTYLVFCRAAMEVVGVYYAYLCSVGLSW